MTQDLYYYETGYIDDSYFVYTADAESQVTSTSSISCDASVIAGGVAVFGSGDLPGFATLTATISHIEGADLFAMTDAALAAAVDRIRDNNISVTSAFTQVTTGSKFTDFGSNLDGEVTFSVDNLRVRITEAAVDAAFSLACDAVRIDGGSIIEASGAWTASSTVSASGVLTRALDATISASFSQSAINDRIRDTDSSMPTSTSLDISSIDVTREISVAIESNFDLSADASRTRSFASEQNALFSPSLTVDIFRNSFAVLDSVSTVSVTAEANKPMAASIESSSQLVSSALVGYQGSAGLTLTSTVSATVDRITKYWSAVQSPSDTIYDLAVDSSGNTVLLASSGNVIKLDQYGLPVLQTKIANSLTNSAIALDSSGNIYGSAGSNVYKFNSSGAIQWQKTQSSSTPVSLSGTATTDSSSNFYVTGQTATTFNRAALVKYNSSGVLQWGYGYGTASGVYNNYDVTVDGSGNIYTIGRNLLAKLDSNGNITWQYSTSNMLAIDSSAGITTDSAGNIYIIGTSGTYPNQDSRLVKLNSSGTVQWIRDIAISGQNSSARNSVSISPSGFIYCIGDDDSASYIVKFTSQGNLVYQNKIVSSSSQVWNIVVTSDSIKVNSIDEIYSLPVNGSGYGDYSAFSYAASDYTISTVSPVTLNASSVTRATLGLTASTSSFTITTGSAAFTNEYISSSAVTQSASAAINSTATAVILTTKFRGAAANLSASAQLTSTVTNVKSAAASLSVDSSLVEITTKIQNASSSLVSNSQLACTVTKFTDFATAASALTELVASANTTRTVEIALESNGFLVSAFGRIRPEVADLTVSSSLTAAAESGKIASADLTVSSSIACTVTKNIGPIISSVSADTAMTVNAVSLPSGSVGMTATFNTVANANRLRGSSSAVNCVVNQQVSATVSRTLTASLVTTSTVAVSALRIKQLASAFASVASELTAINKIGNTLVDLTLVASLTANVKTLASNSATLETSATLTSGSSVNRPTSAVLVSASSMTTSADAGIIGQANLAVTANLSCNALVVNSSSASLSSAFTLTANTGAVRDVIALEMAAASMQVTGNIVKATAANITVLASLNTNAGKQISAVASLLCQGFVLSDAKVINFDASETYVVPRDTNLWSIRAESNLYTIEYEDRSWSFNADSNSISIESTPTYKIKG